MRQLVLILDIPCSQVEMDLALPPTTTILGKSLAYQTQDLSKVINALNSTIHVIFHMRSTYESLKVKTGILT